MRASYAKQRGSEIAQRMMSFLRERRMSDRAS
jgi:hypothetical protein